MNKNSSSAKNSAQEFLSRFHGNAKGFKLPKFEMPGEQRLAFMCFGKHGRRRAAYMAERLGIVAVHVDVDFMGPFVTSVKKASRDVWLQLPPPVRQAAPYAGAGLGTGMLVFSIQQRRLDHAVRVCSFDILTCTSLVPALGLPSAVCRTPKTRHWSNVLKF